MMEIKYRRIAKKWIFLSCVSIGVCSTEGVAFAQGWLEDRERAEGPGIRAGNLELHPGIGAELGYDSNIFYDDENPVDGALLRVSPHLFVSTLTSDRRGGDGQTSNPSTIDFRGGLSASYFHFFVNNAQDNLAGDLGLDLTILPQRPFSLRLYDQYSRSIRPFTENPTSSSLNYAQSNNRAGLELQGRSRGNVLEGKLGYNFHINYFEGDTFRYNTNLTHMVYGDLNWRFFPHTALVHRTEVSFQKYTETDQQSLTLLTDNTRVNSLFGLNGALSQRVSLLALAGYSVGFYDVGDEYDGVVGQAQVTWVPSATFQGSLGYDRSFMTSYIGNFVQQDKGHIGVKLIMSRVFLLGSTVALAYLDYGVPIAPSGALLGNSASRTDWRVNAELFAEYRLTNWLGINSTLRYSGDFTDYEYVLASGSGAAPLLDPADYNKYEAWLGIRAFY